MSASDEFKFLALDSLEIMSGCLLKSMNESQQLAKLNASLIQLAKTLSSGSSEALAAIEGCPPKTKQKFHDSEDNNERQSAPFQQMNRALDLALASQEALLGSQKALEKSIESKNSDYEELKQKLEEQRQRHEIELQRRDKRISQLEEQRQQHKIELQHRDDRISQLEEQRQKYKIELQRRDERISQLSLRLEEEVLMKIQREVSPKNAEQAHECGSRKCIGKPSIQNDIKGVHNYMVETDRKSCRPTEEHRDQKDGDQAISVPENDDQAMRSQLAHLSDMPPPSSPLTFAEELESVENPPDTSLIEKLTPDQEQKGVKYQPGASWADQVETASDQEELSSGSSDKDPAASQDDTLASISYSPVKLYALGTAPNTNRPKRARQLIDPDAHLRTVFVGNLHPSTDADTLEAALNAFGEVINICFKERPGSSYAFVEFKTAEMANAAKSTPVLRLGGRRCRIGPVDGTDFKVQVEGFAEGTTRTVLRRQFGSFGEIRRIFFKSNTSAVIHYSEKRSAEDATAEMDHRKMGGNMALKVRTCFDSKN